MASEEVPLAVLDEQCQLLGIQGLRVVDSSIFPTIPNGNLNAPTIMVAERAADMILGNALEKSSNTPVWIAPNWQEMQRMHPPKRDLESIS